MESYDKVNARLDYGIKKYQEHIAKLKKFQKIYEGTKVKEKLGDEIKKLEGIIQDLENLKPMVQARLTKSQDKKAETSRNIVMSADVHIGEKLVESEKTAEESQKTTIEIIQQESEERKHENVELKNIIKELKNIIKELEKSNNTHHGESKRLTWVFGIGAIVLAFVLNILT